MRAPEALARTFQCPNFVTLCRRYLYDQIYDDPELSSETAALEDCPTLDDGIYVYTSASATFYAPSETAGPGGMHRELIRCSDAWRQEYRRRDTVLIQMDTSIEGFRGMLVGRVAAFLRITHEGISYPCALINWFITQGEEPDDVTRMWIVEPEIRNGRTTFGIVPINSIVRGCHLIGVYEEDALPLNFHFSYTLDAFRSYYVNHYIDYHSYEIIP